MPLTDKQFRRLVLNTLGIRVDYRRAEWRGLNAEQIEQRRNALIREAQRAQSVIEPVVRQQKRARRLSKQKEADRKFRENNLERRREQLREAQQRSRDKRRREKEELRRATQASKIQRNVRSFLERKRINDAMNKRPIATAFNNAYTRYQFDMSSPYMNESIFNELFRNWNKHLKDLNFFKTYMPELYRELKEFMEIWDPRMSEADQLTYVQQLYLDKYYDYDLSQILQYKYIEKFILNYIQTHGPQKVYLKGSFLTLSKKSFNEEYTDELENTNVRRNIKFVKERTYNDKNQTIERRTSFINDYQYVMREEKTQSARLITNQADIKQMTKDFIKLVRETDLNYKYIVGIRSLEIYFANAQINQGGTFKELPAWVKNKQAVINIQNTDDKCFLYSVLADQYRPPKNPNRVSNYEKHLDKLEYEGFEFPMKVKDIPKFETKNNLAINVYTISKQKIVASCVSKKDPTMKRINLLLHEGHYSYIKSMSSLIGHDDNDNACFFCDICCTCNFKSKQALENHKKFCVTNDYQKLEMPTMKEDQKVYITFNKHKALNKLPIRIYADFEAYQDYNDTKQSKNGNTNYYSHHKAASFKFLVVSDIPLDGFEIKQVNNKYIYDYLYRGENSASEFVNKLMMIKQNLIQSIKQAMDLHSDYKRMFITDEQRQEYNMTKSCPCCGCTFDRGSNYKCRHHNHFTGEYIMPLCSKCNLNANLKPNNIDIPVVFHNNNYDKNLFLREFAKYNDIEEISVLPDNSEKFKYFKVGCYSFIDSFRFMPSGLEKLIDNLPIEKRNYLKSLCDDDEQFKYLNRKGIFPYEWFDHVDKFDYPITELIKESFKSEIKRSSGCSDDDFKELLDTVEALKIKTFGEYHDLYLHKDVNGLADVFESFIELSIKTYKLDPCFFVGTPSYGWSAMLLLTKVKLEHLTDIEMYEFYEAGIRGGQSIIMNKKFKANNKYLPDYDPKRPSSYLYYGDANNLYGWAMSKELPINDFVWVQNPEEFDIESLKFDEGATLEVDLRYPEELHDYHNDYPLAPEKIELGGCKKLCGTLYDKHKYIVDYRNLKLYVQHGLEITKIHRVLKYKQEPWLKPWIDKNTDMRKVAKNDFEKDYYKLMNNAVFGKTMENVRNRVQVKLPTTLKKAQKYTNSPNCTKWDIIEENMLLVSLKEKSVRLDKPIYAGFTILDLSKYLMYDFYYGVMKPKYQDNLKLLATDTDSFFFAIYTEDVYKDIWEMREHFDMSEYSKENPLYDETNKKVIGKFKDELGDHVMSEFIGVRPKCYSYEKYSMEDGIKNVKRLKGVPKSIVSKDIKHEDYDKCVSENKDLTCVVHGIRSSMLQNYTIRQKKTALSNTDDKRFWHPSLGFQSLALGNKNIESL